MALFKKKDVSTRIIQFLCPNCGRKHTVPYFKAKEYYLDGTPADIAGALSQVVICECGCICKEGMTAWSGLTDIIANPEYTTILHSNDKESVKKLRLMTFFPLHFVAPEVWLTHVVPAEQLTDVLLFAIQHTAQLTQKYAPLTFGQVVKGTYMKEFQWKYEFDINANLLLADMYRRLGQWDKASALLDAESFDSQDKYMQDYINFQRKLIADKNHQYQ